nr:MAG TPA: hypothetical protein [Caudoviricetes sp.]
MTYEEAMDIGLGIVDQLRFGSNGRNQKTILAQKLSRVRANHRLE